jgi:hypothetical protein
VSKSAGDSSLRRRLPGSSSTSTVSYHKVSPPLSSKTLEARAGLHKSPIVTTHTLSYKPPAADRGDRRGRHHPPYPHGRHPAHYRPVVRHHDNVIFWPYWDRGWGSSLTVGYYDDNWSISLSLLSSHGGWCGRPRHAYYRPYRRSCYYNYVYYYDRCWEPRPLVVYDKVDRLVDDLRYGDRRDRRAAARKLGCLDSLRAVYPLVYALEYDADVFVRFYAAKSLGKIGSREALEPLRWAVETDPEDIVRSEAARAIDRIRY